MDEKTIYTLISRYLNQTASEEEKARLEEWVRHSEENRKRFVQTKKAWLLSDPTLDNQIQDSRLQVWNTIIEKIPGFKPYQYTRRSLLMYCSLSAAAAILLMISIHLFFWDNKQQLTPQYTDFYLPKGEKGHITLPDETKVWVNADTKISLCNEFNTKNRKIRIEGEGYFEVTKDTHNKFIVETSSIDVVVHGTTFKLTAYPNSTEVSVALREGAVSIMKNDSKELIANLTPNQRIVIDKQNYSYTKTDFNPDSFIAWTFDELVFEYATVEDVFSQMENWYGVNFHIVNAKKDLKYRFRIKTESMTEILQLMNKMTPMEYQINGKEVTVRYK